MKHRTAMDLDRKLAQASKRTQICPTWVFFLLIFPCNFDYLNGTKFSQTYLVHNAGIRQVKYWSLRIKGVDCLNKIRVFQDNAIF